MQTEKRIEDILKKIAITQHAKERYAERIMGRDDILDIKRYVLENEEKIKKDLAKMLQYGEVIYTGKPLNDPTSKKNADVILTGTWIIYAEAGTYKVITLYKIDFSVGEDFNKQYIERCMKKIELAKRDVTKADAEISESLEGLSDQITKNEEEINNYKELIGLKSKENEGLREICDSLKANSLEAEMKLRGLLAQMIGKKFF